MTYRLPAAMLLIATVGAAYASDEPSQANAGGAKVCAAENYSKCSAGDILTGLSVLSAAKLCDFSKTVVVIPSATQTATMCVYVGNNRELTK